MVTKILKESMQNLPDWFTQNADKSILNALDREGFDLYNCEFTPISKSSNRAFEWNSGDAIAFLFEYTPSWDNAETERDVAVWIDGELYGDFFIKRRYGKKSRRDLLEEATEVAVIRKYVDSNVKDSSKEKYHDPRYYSNSFNQWYAGQKQDEDGDWYMPFAGRDKSGYEIPTPEYWQQRAFDEFGFGKYDKQLEDYYNKIVSAKERLFDATSNTFDISKYNGSGAYIGKAFTELEAACFHYNSMLNEINKVKENIESAELHGLGKYELVDSRHVSKELQELIEYLDEDLENLDKKLANF